MKRTYKIKNLHCADCARSLQEAIQSIRGVVNVEINFFLVFTEVQLNNGKKLEQHFVGCLLSFTQNHQKH